MSIPSYAANIKSSGIYRYVFDKSIVPVSERSAIRLVVGYSEKGPFNQPVYIEDAADFIRLFGNISRRMERKGIFFHRTALHALEAGPILALNLKPFNEANEKEQCEIYAFNASDLHRDQHTHKGAVLVAPPTDTKGLLRSTIFDTNRFWKVDVERVHEMTGKDLNETVNDYIRIVQTGSKEDSCTVFIRSYKPTNYDIKVNDWYQALNDELPVYLESVKDELLSDFFAEVFVFKGNLLDKNLFKHTGSLGTFRNLKFNYETVVLEAVKDDGQNEVLSKKILLNDGVLYDDKGKPVSGYKSVTKTKANLVGIVLEDNKTVLTESGLDVFVTKALKTNGIDITFDEFTPEYEKVVCWQPFLVDGKSNEDYVDYYGAPGDALAAMANTSTSGFLMSYRGTLLPNIKDSNNRPVSLDQQFNGDFRDHKMLMHFDELLLEKASEIDLDENGIYGDGETPFHTKTTRKGVYSGDEATTMNHIGSVKGVVYALCSPSKLRPSDDFLTLLDSSLAIADTTEFAKVFEGKVSEDVMKQLKLMQANINSDEAAYNKAADAMVQHLIGDPDSKFVTKEPLPNAATAAIYIQGYDYKSIGRSESGKELVEKILRVLSYKGIREALTNNVDVDYHYIVDSFQSYPGLSIKSVLFNIAKEKDNAFAIVNFPTIDDVMRHVGYKGYQGGFDMKDITKNDAGISLPTESQGASWGAFYTQLVATDGSTKFTIPSAGLVSKLFLEKWKSRQPYYIVAGPNHGRIDHATVVAPDYSYSRNDLDILEPMGVNAIIHMPRYGIVINSNQTAKQTPVTALSKAHVRELIIFLQNEIEEMLRGYQWELNTASLREAIRAKADVILGKVEANGGLYAWKTKCDDTNNTPEVIDNEMVILDIDIEPARGAGKMIQTLTIHRTGGIRSVQQS